MSDREQAFLLSTVGSFTADDQRRLAIGHTVCDLFGGYPPDTAAVEHLRATLVIGLEVTATPDEATSKPFINAAINTLCPQYGSYIE